MQLCPGTKKVKIASTHQQKYFYISLVTLDSNLQPTRKETQHLVVSLHTVLSGQHGFHLKKMCCCPIS